MQPKLEAFLCTIVTAIVIQLVFVVITNQHAVDERRNIQDELLPKEGKEFGSILKTSNTFSIHKRNIGECCLGTPARLRTPRRAGRSEGPRRRGRYRRPGRPERFRRPWRFGILGTYETPRTPGIPEIHGTYRIPGIYGVNATQGILALYGKHGIYRVRGTPEIPGSTRAPESKGESGSKGDNGKEVVTSFPNPPIGPTGQRAQPGPQWEDSKIVFG
ncbi:hypothetical protein Trydic_g11590 [Trypoxylus dichotomus]